MDEVDAGSSWARYRGQTLLTDQDQGFYDSSPIKTSTFSSEVYSVSTFGTSPNSGITSVQHHGSFSHGALSLPGAGYDDIDSGLDINHQLQSTATLPNESAISDEASGCTIISSPELALLLKAGLEKYLLIDSRSFLEYNTSHIQQSANVCCSKLIKRRLQRDKVHIRDLLTQTCHIDIDEFVDIIVYDQCTEHPRLLTDDTFLCVLLQKLSATFKRVALLRGGFLAFQAMYPSLCESKSNSYRCAALTSLSQPCLPVSNVGPTRILPFLYLGSQQDALSPDIVQVNEITYVLNVSTTCIKPPHISDGHFLRIPVNDNYSAKLQPYFKEAFQFLDKVREANGCCLVHCLAGISRSPTLAIAYIMRHLNMSSDDAYRYVKDKRPTISPNFNFLGQLLEFEKDIKRAREMNNNNSDGSLGQKSESRLWSNYVMDLSTHSPSSPVAKNMRPFVFDVSSLTQRPAAVIGHRTVVEGKTEQKSMENVGSGQELTFPLNANSEAERRFPRKLISSSNHIYQSSNVVKQEVTVSTQRSPFPFSKDSTLPRPNVLNLGFEPTTRRVPGTLLNSCKDSSHSMSKSLTDIREASDTESPSPSMCMDSKEHAFTTSTITFASRNVKPLLSPFPCGESTIADHSLIMDQTSACNAVSETSGNIHSSDKTREVQLVTSNVTDRSACDNSPSLSSRTEPNYSPQPQTPVTSSANSPFSFSETFLKSRGKRPLRNSLSLSLSPITPTRPKPPTHLPVDSGDIPAEKCVPSACKIERKVGETLSDTYNKPNIPAIPSSSSCTSSVTTSHVVKLKSFSFSSSSMSLPAQSPTSSLARLHFGSADTSDSENDRDMDTSQSESKLPSPEHVSINRRAFSEPIDRDKFYSFPSTSLDKLNFTPCLSNSTENIQTCCSSSRTVGVKRPLNNDILDLKESDLSSQGSLNCSMTSSSNNSSVSSPTTSGSQQKVVVRKREGRAKRTLVRPNSIAFSTYPTFDLGSDCQDSPNSASSTASQDDSCETYVQNGKKSKSSEYMTDVRFRLGRYSEREVYRQITAAMETAMLKTQAFEASRKSRSLDDILSSEDDSSAPNSPKMTRLSVTSPIL